MTIARLEDSIASYHVAHVTFFIVPREDVEGMYNVWSATHNGEPQFIDVAFSFEEANVIIGSETKKLETLLEAKRNKKPTAKQLLFLFNEKISIPIDLTWGQASEIIEEKLAQYDKEKQEYFEAKARKYNGFAVGMQVYYEPLKPLIGKIEKLTSSNDGLNKYAHVKFEGYRVSKLDLDSLQKIEQEVSA